MTSIDALVRQGLRCVEREYPHYLVHIVNSPRDLGTQRRLHPAFYGCFDWHSSVHTHWLLAHVLREPIGATLRRRTCELLAKHLTVEKMRTELAYVRSRRTFEVPYGAAWLLALEAELATSFEPRAAQWRRALAPLAARMREHLLAYTSRLYVPYRSGEHSQTAFALGLALDAARALGDRRLERTWCNEARRLFLDRAGASLSWEPGPYDFLSPALSEAELVARILPAQQFGEWLARFLPEWPLGREADALVPCRSLDRSDGKLVHADGLNLSRAWMLSHIARALPSGDPRVPALEASALRHRREGLRHAVTRHYAGAHWLGTYAMKVILP